MQTVLSVQSNQKWSWPKRIFVALLILGAILFLLWQYIHLPNYWDDAEINDADLMMVIPPAAPAQDNAATYISIQNDISDSDADILDRIPVYENGAFSRNGVSLSDEMIRAYVVESRPLADAFVGGSMAEVYQCPLSYGKNSYNSELCSLNTLRSYGNLVAFQAQYYASVDDYRRAGVYAESLLRFGALVTNQEVPSGILEHLVGAVLYEQGLGVLENNPSLVPLVKSRLHTYKISSEAQVNVFKSEYLSTKEAVSDSMIVTNADGTVFSTYYHQPYRTINTIAQMWRVNIRNVSTECGIAIDNSEWEAFEEAKNNETTLGSLLKPNFTGRVLIEVIMASLGSVREKRCDVNGRLEALSN